MIKRIAEVIFWVVAAAIILWLLCSWVDVLNNNLGGECHLKFWNFFQITFGKYLS